MEYTVVEAPSVAILSAFVELKLNLGYRLQGGVSAVKIGPDEISYLQALVKN